MKILVTGGSGFIGTHLVRRLLAEGHKVTIVDLKRPDSQLDVIWHKRDITDPEEDIGWILRAQVTDVVYHLAANVSVSKSYADPGTDALQNIVGTARVARAVSEYGAKLIFTSSAAVYGREKDLPTREDEKFDPHPPTYYGLSKKTAEEYIQKIYIDFGLRYNIVRLANVYGPGQTLDGNGEGGVTTMFLTRMRDHKPTFITNSGNQVRDFIYVSDVVDALVKLLHYHRNDTFNIGTGDGTSINWLWHLCAKITEYDDNRRHDYLDIGEVDSYLDCAKARQYLNWKPEVKLNDGLSLVYQSLLGK